MTTRILTIVLALLLGVAPGEARDESVAPAPAPAPDEVILKFKPGTDPETRVGLLAGLGARQTIPLGRSGALLVRLAAPTAATAVDRHAGNPILAYIEPNFVYAAALVPNESWFSQQWSLLNTGQTGGTPGADIHATSAWDLATGLPSVVVGVIDSGIDLAHPDLAANLYVNPDEIPGNGVDDDANGFIDDVHGWDFVNDDNDPQDDNGHGTLMAGIAGAVANNGVGIAGVCWRVSLLPIKFLDDGGFGTTADAIRALDYAVTMGVPITNNAWGGGAFSQALLDAILAAEQAGTVFVASAGAESLDLDVHPVYPASYDTPGVVAVAASDHDDLLAASSNYGVATVDLAAPGVGILTTQLGATYTTMSGTSAATAHVCGALALVLTRFPQASGLRAAMHLLDHAEKVPSLTGLVRTGRLDAYAPLVTAPSGVLEDGDGAATVGAGPRLWWQPASGDGIRFGLDLPRGGETRLTVFDVRGRCVREVFAGSLVAGPHAVIWDTRTDRGRRAASGVYLARLQGRSGCATTRIVIDR